MNIWVTVIRITAPNSLRQIAIRPRTIAPIEQRALFKERIRQTIDIRLQLELTRLKVTALAVLFAWWLQVETLTESVIQHLTSTITTKDEFCFYSAYTIGLLNSNKSK